MPIITKTEPCWVLILPNGQELEKHLIPHYESRLLAIADRKRPRGAPVNTHTPPIGLDLDEIRALDVAATEGPWELGDSSTLYMSGQSVYYVRIKGKPGIRIDMTAHRADAELIVAARNAVPLLLAEIDRLRALPPGGTDEH